MRKIIEIENRKYELIDDNNNAFDLEELKNKYTDYFDNYDYILGDWAYGKLRLKGFYESDSKNCSKINDIKNYKTYVKEECAYGCKYFLIKKVID